MAAPQRYLELIKEKNGLDLRPIDLTSEIHIDSDHGYDEYLTGPYRIESESPAEKELLIFFTYSVTDSTYIQFLIRDCEGDFLNHGVAEQDSGINEKPINLSYDELKARGWFI